MRKSLFFALGVFLLLVSKAQSGSLPKENTLTQATNYVVIGAFAKHNNAINFTNQAVKNNFGAKYEMNVNRNLYYVYVMTTDNHDEAIAEALRLRKESPYFDTWVYNGLLGKEGEHVTGTDINPVTTQQIQQVESNESQEVKAETIVPVTAEKEAVAANEEEEVEEITGKKFFFRIYRGDNSEPVEGDVNVIDAQRARKMGTYAGNKPVGVSPPNNKDGSISLVCEVFGYRKVQRDLNYDTPQGEDIQVSEENGTIVPFELMRLQKGDHAIMYHVYFFNDAAIMRPESRFEVNSLLEMLNENTKYKIRIHGHTNGNHRGKIIYLKEGADNFFALNNTNEIPSGSAKKLSGMRAELIRDFLVANGVQPDRMEVKAWGGKKAIYDKHSAQAQSNVRVEIEILEN